MDIISTPLLIAAISAIIVFILYMAINAKFGVDNHSERLRAIEENYDYNDSAPPLMELDQELSDLAKLCNKTSSMLGVDTTKSLEDWKKKCMHAGINSVNAPSFFLFYKSILGVFIAIIGIVIAYIAATSANSKLSDVAIGSLIVIIGMYAADIYINNRTKKRAKILQHSFPDTLDLIVVCVESGLALDAALAKVCGELGKAHPEITAELNQTRVELALLNDRPQALTNLAERTNLVSFRSLVAALIQTEKFGTSLTDTLRVLSEDYRLTRLMNVEEKAAKLPVLMTLPLILLLLPVFFIVILGPPIVRVIAQGGLFGNG